MAFIEILNSKLLYILVILGIGFILVFSLHVASRIEAERKTTSWGCPERD